jgi:hypothetical protein
VAMGRQQMWKLVLNHDNDDDDDDYDENNNK